MAANLERRAENLAYVFQEVLTVGERLRAGRQQVSDTNTFRHQIREGLKLADNEARRRGYTAEDIQLAIFAAVALMDEFILNLRNPIFADWPRRPLQEEMFGHQIAGELFFKHLQSILGRNESQETADLLEIYYLCMLLGFVGKYSLSGRGELHAILQATGEKIDRIRQMSRDLSPHWALPGDSVRVTLTDPWIKRLMYIAGGFVLLAVVLFAMYKLFLGGRVSDIERIASLALGVQA